MIGRKFHVSYSVSGATRLMHRLSFSPQVPARRVAERDEQAVTVWREATWAEVDERGRPAGAATASRTRQASPAVRPKDAPVVGAGGARPAHEGFEALVSGVSVPPDDVAADHAALCLPGADYLSLAKVSVYTSPRDRGPEVSKKPLPHRS
ncbi:winged helix-turn-helix domain-containing protein [Streptomyces sp. BE20]|nr:MULTISPECIES: winged helix-turn-helix domain-containing protein [unclassified Streptomyces]MED7947560.1 winged helix-turn-helix domain-containing protein [Streptomyces sp. BE303]MEE1821261.1 winged helix-turn-helix domain-containing protein [Streptomyces sp. BE20]